MGTSGTLRVYQSIEDVAPPARVKNVGEEFIIWARKVMHDHDRGRPSIMCQNEHRAGWPALAFVSHDSWIWDERGYYSPTGTGSTSLAFRRTDKASGNNTWFIVPAIPLFPGFIINTALYALLPAAILPPLLAARLKRRAGRCPRCRYDLTGLPDSARVCPECGRTLPATLPHADPPKINPWRMRTTTIRRRSRRTMRRLRC